MNQKDIVRVVWDILPTKLTPRCSQQISVEPLTHCQATKYAARKSLLRLGKLSAKKTPWKHKPEESRVMKVKFTLTMDDLTVDNQHYDSVVIDWVSDVQQEEVLEMSQRWISSQNYLTRKMIGLQRVGESALTIEPVDESTPA